MAKNRDFMWWSMTAKSVPLYLGLMVALVVAPMSVMAEEQAEEVDEAQEDEAQEDEASDDYDTRRAALLKIRAGNDAFDDEEYQEAYDNYASAYELLQEPLVMYRMGQSAELLGEASAAVDHYLEYREIGGDDEEFLARIDAALPDLKEQLRATVEITSEPEGAAIIVIGPEDAQETEVGVTPDTIRVDPGTVQISLRLDGYEEATLHEELDRKQEHSWDATLSEVQEQEEVAEVQELPAAEDSGEVSDSNMSMWGWTSVGLGVSMLALGGTMTMFQRDATEQVNDFDRGAAGAAAQSQEERDTLRAEQEALRSDAETYHRVAMGSYIAGGLLTAAGASLLLIDFMGSDDGNSGGLSMDAGVGPDGGFVGIGGQF